MNETELALFLEERKTGIGGSDVQAVLNLEPWGCSRRLWYQKRDVPPDYEDTDKEALFERGHALEPIVAQMWMERNPQSLNEVGLIRHPDHSELLVHLDRVIVNENTDSDKGDGVLEIKTCGQRQWYKVKREGLPYAYIAQMQHSLMVSGLTWGEFAVFWPDGWQMVSFPVDRDEQMGQHIMDACLAFWVQVQNGPAPDALPPTDPRCERCPWRTSCQGAALAAVCKDAVDGGFDPALRSLAEEYFQAKEMSQEAEELYEGVKERMRAALGQRSAVETVGARIYYRGQTSMRWDTKALDKDFPQLAPKYKKASMSRPLRVFPI
jgi:putative phage-type endonuclease